MLCEQCQQQEATVHFTVVVGASAETGKRDLCEACYPAVEAERFKAYNKEKYTPPPPDIEDITALEFLQLSAKANRNEADMPAYRKVTEELKHFPKSEQRLAFEMLELTWQSLERGQDPSFEAMHAACYRRSIDAERLPIYAMWLEKISLRCFELRNQLPAPIHEHSPFVMTLSLMLMTLSHVYYNGFRKVFEQLKSQCSETDLKAHWKMLQRIEQMITDFECNPTLGWKEWYEKHRPA